MFAYHTAGMGLGYMKSSFPTESKIMQLSDRKSARKAIYVLIFNVSWFSFFVNRNRLFTTTNSSLPSMQFCCRRDRNCKSWQSDRLLVAWDYESACQFRYSSVITGKNQGLWKARAQIRFAIVWVYQILHCVLYFHHSYPSPKAIICHFSSDISTWNL